MLDEKFLYMNHDVYVYVRYIYISHIYIYIMIHIYIYIYMMASLYRRHCKVREPDYDSENDSVGHCHLCLTYRGRKVNEFLKHLW